LSKLNNADKKRALILRLKRVEGQLRGIQHLIDTEADCEDIAQQLSASRKALDKAFFAMVGCLLDQESTGGRKLTATRGDYISQMLARFA
jgi:CsoR family transcriptional regulator, copper-sensing transcriptional repressor